MSNVALTSLVILLFATPGYIARSAYFSGRFSSAVLPRNLMDDIARAVFYSLPFHAAGMGAIHHLRNFGTGYDIDFSILFRLLSGDYGKGSEFLPAIIQNLYSNLHKIGVYFVGISSVAFFAGRFLRHQVWKREWDVKYPALFGYQNKWVYTFFGRGKKVGESSKVLFSYMDAIVELGEKTRIYRGVIYEFTTDDSGALRDIVLIESLRGKFRTEAVDGEGTFYWEPIPGDFFVLKYAEIKNMNITYVTSSSRSSQPVVPGVDSEATDLAASDPSISQ